MNFARIIFLVLSLAATRVGAQEVVAEAPLSVVRVNVTNQA